MKLSTKINFTKTEVTEMIQSLYEDFDRVHTTIGRNVLLQAIQFYEGYLDGILWDEKQ